MTSMQEELEDFNVRLNLDRTKYDIGVKIVSQGTIYLNLGGEEWSNDPPERPAVSMGYEVESSTVEESPEWKIVWMDIYENGDIIEIIGAEEVNGYMVLNPDKREYIEERVEMYCERELVEDAIDQGESTFAYDVHVSDPSDRDDHYYGDY